MPVFVILSLMRLTALFLVMAIVTVAPPVLAQDSGDDPDDAYILRVIQDDGSVVEFDLRAKSETKEPQITPQEQAEEGQALVPSTQPARQAKAAPEGPRVPKPARRPVTKIKRKKAMAQEIMAKGIITGDQALSIALENAPPASSFKMSGRLHEGKPVFAVMFETDSGPYEILVDAQTSEIISSRQKESAPPVKKWPTKP